MNSSLTNGRPVPHIDSKGVEQDGSTIDLVCFPDGHLALIVETNGQQTEHHFQCVSIEEGGIVKFAFSWGQAGVSAAAGGQMLSTFEESGGQVLDLKIKGKVSYEIGYVSVSPEVLRKVPRDEWLFLETMGDVTRKLTSTSRYELVRLSALLRQLLCDATPFAQEINRKFKLDLVFEVAIKDKELLVVPDVPQTSWRSLYPDTQEEAAGVNLERFLKLGTITHKGVVCTVGDVIDVVAHVFGGVHYGQPLNDGNLALEVLEKEVLIYDESVVVHSLLDIGKVTLKALIPLVEVIVKNS